MFDKKKVMINVVEIIGIKIIISLNFLDEIIIKIVLIIVSIIIIMDIGSNIKCCVIEKLFGIFKIKIINKDSIVIMCKFKSLKNIKIDINGIIIFIKS